MTHREIEIQLLSVLSDISGIPLSHWRIGTRAGERPTMGVFGVVVWKRTEALKQIEDPELKNRADGDLEYTDLNACYCTVEIRILGENSYSILNDIVFALQAHNRTWDLWKDLGYGGTSEVQTSAIPLGGRMQEISTTTLSFYANFERTYLADYFTRVPVDITNTIDNSVRHEIWPENIKPNEDCNG